MPPVRNVINFKPTNADAAVPIVIAEGHALPTGKEKARLGVKMRFLNKEKNKELEDAGCWRFVLNGALNTLPVGLETASELLTAMFDPADLEFRRVIDTNRELPVPPDCQPARVVATQDTAGSVRAGTQLITDARQTELRNAYFRARQDPLRGEECGQSTIIHRTGNQQEFHYLLMKTLVQLYGFVTIPRAQVVNHKALSRQLLTIVVRSSTWWGWDHWGFQGSLFNGSRMLISKYAQKTPEKPLFVGSATLWDEHLPETCVYVAKMPQNVLSQLRNLRTA